MKHKSIAKRACDIEKKLRIAKQSANTYSVFEEKCSTLKHSAFNAHQNIVHMIIKINRFILLIILLLYYYIIIYYFSAWTEIWHKYPLKNCTKRIVMNLVVKEYFDTRFYFFLLLFYQMNKRSIFNIKF